MYLVFTSMPGKSYRRRLRSLLLCLCDVVRPLINSLVCWFIFRRLSSLKAVWKWRLWCCRHRQRLLLMKKKKKKEKKKHTYRPTPSHGPLMTTNCSRQFECTHQDTKTQTAKWRQENVEWEGVIAPLTSATTATSFELETGSRLSRCVRSVSSFDFTRVALSI